MATSDINTTTKRIRVGDRDVELLSPSDQLKAQIYNERRAGNLNPFMRFIARRVK